MSRLRRTLLGALVGAVAGPVMFAAFSTFGVVVCAATESDNRDVDRWGLAGVVAVSSLLIGLPFGAISGAA